MTLPLGGWDPVVIAINAARFDKLSASQKAMLTQAVQEGLEAPAWAAAEGGLAGDIACLTGKGECKAGKAASMTLVEPSAADREAARKVLTSEVLPAWATRAGGDWAKRWNDSVGKTVGVTIPVK